MSALKQSTLIYQYYRLDPFYEENIGLGILWVIRKPIIHS